jgi:N-acetyl-gamma-glutamylphosphate reductase
MYISPIFIYEGFEHLLRSYKLLHIHRGGAQMEIPFQSTAHFTIFELKPHLAQFVSGIIHEFTIVADQ